MFPSQRLITVLVSACIFFMVLFHLSVFDSFTVQPARLSEEEHQRWQSTVDDISLKAKAIIQTPLQAPYKDKFAQLGDSTKVLGDALRTLDDFPDLAEKQSLLETIELAAVTLYPYLQNSPKYPDSLTPLSDLRSSIIPGSRGIVIPTGTGTLRYAAHLIGSLRDVIHCTLPIQIIYAGDKDLPSKDRESLLARFPDVQFLDVLSVLDDKTVDLENGGWAIKAFAALYTPFEQVILLDADCVFVQDPELYYSDPLYTSTGALLFHDRLLWQHAFKSRHDWWKSQIKNPSATLNKSLVWTEDYAEEGDSGVVVVDKRNLDVFLGLLHIAWQNNKEVRDEVTYTITYGDKESWWLGFELTGAAYSFEDHYGSMVGWLKEELEDAKSRICSFVIGHVDAMDELFWYNGGLLKNKKVDPLEFAVPTHTMVDGKWEKGASKKDMSCMVGDQGKELQGSAQDLLKQSITLAKQLDEHFGFV